MIKLYLKIFVRTFFIQSLWNLERLQNIGFLYCLRPFIDYLYADKNERKTVLLRHTEYFSTHPFTANILIAIVANMEAVISQGQGKTILNVNFLKSAMGGPLSTIGDSIFWGPCRTGISFIAIFLVVFFARVHGVGHSEFAFIIPLVFLFVYNAFHIPVRCWLLFVSFAFDGESTSAVSKLEIRFLFAMINMIVGFVMVVSTICYFVFFGFRQNINLDLFGMPITDIIVFAAIFVLSFLFGRVPATIKFFALILLCVTLGYIGI